MPANGETCEIITNPDIPLEIALPLIEKEEKEYDQLPPDPKRQRLIHGILIMKDNVSHLKNLDCLIIKPSGGASFLCY